MKSRLNGASRNTATHDQYVVAAFGKELTCGTKGALGELAVSSDLMKRGYEVFRALSPDAAFDLIASKGAMLLRIECRCGTFHAKTGKISFAKTQPRSGRVLPDHYAVVLSGQIVYEPPLED